MYTFMIKLLCYLRLLKLTSKPLRNQTTFVRHCDMTNNQHARSVNIVAEGNIIPRPSHTVLQSNAHVRQHLFYANSLLLNVVSSTIRILFEFIYGNSKMIFSKQRRQLSKLMLE